MEGLFSPNEPEFYEMIYAVHENNFFRESELIGHTALLDQLFGAVRPTITQLENEERAWIAYLVHTSKRV